MSQLTKQDKLVATAVIVAAAAGIYEGLSGKVVQSLILSAIAAGVLVYGIIRAKTRNVVVQEADDDEEEDEYLEVDGESSSDEEEDLTCENCYDVLGEQTCGKEMNGVCSKNCDCHDSEEEQSEDEPSPAESTTEEKKPE